MRGGDNMGNETNEETAIAVPDESKALDVPDAMLDDIVRTLTTGEGPEMIEVDLPPEKIQQQIVERILRSQTLDEILASFEATPIDEVLDRPFEIHAVRWERSDYEQGNPYYCLIDAVMIDSGERLTLTTGATNVEAQVLAMQKGGYLPAKVIARQSAKPTKNGYLPKHLERAE